MIAAARTEQSKEISRLILISCRAIFNLISKFSTNAIKKTSSHNKAVSELKAMDDWALQNIGVLRSMISYAVRGQMIDKKLGFEVTAPRFTASVDKVATSLPANNNKIQKYNCAAWTQLRSTSLWLRENQMVIPIIQPQNKATTMIDNATTPALMTDKMIRAAQYGCGLTPLEAILVYETMSEAFEKNGETIIYESIMKKQKMTAILAADAVDIRAGNAVRKALEIT